MSNGDTFLAELKRWQEHAKYWHTEYQTRQTNFEKAMEATRSGALRKELGYFNWLKYNPTGTGGTVEETARGFRGIRTEAMMPSYHPGMYKESAISKENLANLTSAYMNVSGTLTPAAEMRFLDTALNREKESNWLVWFYGAAPKLIAAGLVSSFDDLLAYPNAPNSNVLSPAAVDIARKAVGQMTQQITPTTEAGEPSWAEVTPEQEAAVKKFLAGATYTSPIQTINTMTVDEIAKALRILPTGAEELPYSEEETLRLMSIMDLPIDAVAEKNNTESVIAEYSKAVTAQQEQVDAVLAKTSDWRTPKLSVWDSFKLLAASPFIPLGEIMQPYIEHVSYPLAGSVVISFQRLWPGYQGLERSYDELKARGENWWAAPGKAWEEWGAPWYLKLPVEIIVDPLTWIPGWGLSKPAALAKRIGLIKVGTSLTWVNKGMYAALDIPFDYVKSFMRHIPKSFSQEITHEVNQTLSHIWAAADMVAPGARTAESFEKTITAALDAYRLNPAGKDVLANLGRELSDFAPMSVEQLQVWSKKLGGELTAEAAKAPSTSQQVTYAMTSMVNKTLPDDAAAKVIAGALNIVDTPDNIKVIIKDTNAYLNRFVRGAQDAINVAKATKLGPFREGMQVIKNTRTKVIKATQASRTAEGDFLTGIVLGLQRYTEAWTRGKWQQIINNYLIRPMAEANLGSLSYPIWNAFEGIAVSLLEGVTPGFAKPNVTKALFHGVTLDVTIRETVEQIEKRASDVAQITGMGKNNAFSFIRLVIPEEFSVMGKTLHVPQFLAGKDYLQWFTGAKMLDFSNFLGNHFRTNFITQKMAQRLVELGENVNGKNIYLAMKKLVKGKSPTISGSRFGLTKGVLESEAWYRILTGDRNFVAALADDISSGSLQIAEVMKIIRKSELLSPRAKALAEQEVVAGKVMADYDSITAFAKRAANATIEDLRARPMALPDNFAAMAGQIELMEVKTADDLMDVYQMYYAMSLDAYNLPSTMMSHTMEESNVLRNAGKSDRVIDQLWRTKRGDLEAAVASMDASLERIKSKIVVNADKLTSEQSDAMLQILDFKSARFALRENTLKLDRKLLDDFWGSPRAGRDYDKFWSDRDVIWANHRREDAIFAGQEFLQGEAYARLYGKLPPEHIIPVDASARALSQDDVAKVLGCNVDNLTSGLMENTAQTQSKESFIQIILQKAKSRPNSFKGFTEERIGKVYDEILEGIKMRPGVNVDEQKILHQVEAMRQDMITLKLAGTLTPSEETALKSWAEELAKGVDDIFSERMYTTDVGLFEHIATEAEMADFELRVKGVMKLNPGMSEEAARLEVFGAEKIKVVADYDALNTLKDRLTKLGESAKVPEGATSIEELMRRWFERSDNDALQTVCRLAKQDREYLGQIHAILKKQYPSGYIRIYRGSGQAGKQALDRDFVNVTSSKRVAGQFEDTWAPLPHIPGTPEVPLAIDNVVIKVDDVISIGSVDESELFISSAVLRDRIANPIKPPATVTRAEWQGVREKASQLSHQDYYKAFADYTNQNLVDAMMRTIYPYWCVPTEYEILTREGWRTYDRLSIGEEVLTVNPKTLLYEWQPLEDISSFEFDGELMSLPYKDGKEVLFTSDHRWLTITTHRGKPVIKRSFELTDGYDLVPRALPYTFPDDSILSPRDAAILGWVVTDGTITKGSTYPKIKRHMSIYQSSKKYLGEIAELTGSKPSPNGPISTNYQVRVKQVDTDRILSICYSRQLLPQLVTLLSMDAAEAMWGAMFKAEGNSDNGWLRFKQLPGPVSEAFQVLSLLLGKGISVTSDKHGLESTYIISNNKPYQAKQMRRLGSKHYVGKIWCPKTANGTWVMKANGKVLPTGNTYHTYRWFFLPRTFLRHPGVALAWGKYQNYSDNGYIHLPGTNLDLNPFVGSVMGSTFGLARHDYKSYFENLGQVGEALDLSQRYGFFPNAWLTGLATFTPVLSGRPPEFGEVLPPFGRMGLNLLRGSNIPGVKDAADWLQDKLFHDNFRDYYIATEVSALQVEANGGIIGGQSGVDLWNKIRDKVKLTEEEQAVWDEATLRASWYSVLRTQFPQFRLREEEYLDAYQQVTQIIEQQLGMSEEYQDYLWKHNMRPTDVVGGLPLDLRNTLDQMWQWRIWFGRGQILMPPEISDLYGKLNKYWDKVKTYQTERLSTQGDADTGFIAPTSQLHFTGREWREQYAANWSGYVTKTDALATDPEFADAIDAMTPEGQVKLAKRLGFASPVRGPWDEAIDLYFSIELEKTRDPYTGEEDDDYLKFWLNREAVRQALTDEQRADFDAYIRRYETPMEHLFRDVSNKYLRGYRAVPRILEKEYTPELLAVIKEFYADTTTSVRKAKIRELIGPDGNKLISGWESKLSDARIRLREASPRLDFWLYVFGYITKPRTTAAQAMVDTWEVNRASILSGY